MFKDIANDFNGIDHIAVVGLGETGYSCVKYFAQHDVKLTVLDSRTNPPKKQSLEKNFPEVNFIGGHFEQKCLDASQLIILSPGVSIDTKEIKKALSKGVPVIGDIELFALAQKNNSKSKIVAITGSNGKSTVTTLVTEILNASGIKTIAGGNLGIPALDLLCENIDCYVLELSSFQLEMVHSLTSFVACIVNISADHMDRYPSIQGYVQAKRKIYENASAIVYSRYDDRTYPENSAVHQISFGFDTPQSKNDFGILKSSDHTWLVKGKKKIIAVEKLKLKGRHNQLNCLTALAIVDFFGVDEKVSSQVLQSFAGLAHRFEFIGVHKNVTWINDSKATNPGATVAAIDGQKQPIVLIVGGDAKQADFRELGEVIKNHVKAVVLFGRDSFMIEKMLPTSLPRIHAISMEQVVKIADHYALADEMVVFSPACASFDLYQNYEQRGNDFKDKVKEYFHE